MPGLGHLPRASTVWYLWLLRLLIFMPCLWLASIQIIFAANIVSLSAKGAIGPAMSDYLIRGMEAGKSADLILIQLDTPGGLNKSTRHIVQAMLTSPTPIVVYVAPSGARAASAGTILLYASTIAAMAPGTHLGAASPVNLTDAMSQGGKKEQPSTLEQKATKDAVAYMRTLAQLRGRNPDFAEKAVLEAATLTATEALEKDVIDVIATSDQDLLQQLNGKMVTQNGKTIKLKTTKAEFNSITPDWRMKFLLVITDPTIAYLLLLLGIYGIFFELFNPGFIVPGVIGAVAIIIALYALQLLPINYAGLALIILGIMFIIAEAFVPSFGVLGLGGTVGFVIGSIMLIDTPHASYQIAWSAIWAMAAANIVIFMVLLSMAVRSRYKPVMHGTNTLIGATGRALGDISPKGQAVIRGEIWSVYADAAIHANTPVRVIGAYGLKLKVEAVETQGD